MQIQEFARKVESLEYGQMLYRVEIFQEGQWVALPERHHNFSLAWEVAGKESKSRQCATKVRGYKRR